MRDTTLVQRSRTVNGVGIATGIGEGLVYRYRRASRSGVAEARGRVVICDAIGDSEAVLLALARPSAVVITGVVSHSVASVLREARVPAVGEVMLEPDGFMNGTGVIVDGFRGRIWRNALLVSADLARR